MSAKNTCNITSSTNCQGSYRIPLLKSNSNESICNFFFYRARFVNIVNEHPILFRRALLSSGRSVSVYDQTFCGGYKSTAFLILSKHCYIKIYSTSKRSSLKDSLPSHIYLKLRDILIQQCLGFLCQNPKYNTFETSAPLSLATDLVCC